MLSITTIPRYGQGNDHDSIDLQIKSLLYNFKRLRINRLTPIYHGDLKYTSNFTFPNEDSYYKKLDKLYNVQYFKQLLVNDEYRIMIDFLKNKFRSYCIVSEVPSEKLSSSVSYQCDGDFPLFTDYKDRTMTSFKFSKIELENITMDYLAGFLSHSDLYIEHHSKITYHQRYDIAMDAIKSVRSMINTEKFNLTHDDKANIIRQYLISLSFNIQLNRLYNEYLRLNPIINNHDTKPNDAIHKSPTKLTKRPSLSYLNLAGSINPTGNNDNDNTKNHNKHQLRSAKSMNFSSLSLGSVKLSPRKSFSDLSATLVPSRSPSPSRCHDRTTRSPKRLTRSPERSPERWRSPERPDRLSEAPPTLKAKPSLSKLGNLTTTEHEVDKQLMHKCKTAIQQKLYSEKQIVAST